MKYRLFAVILLALSLSSCFKNPTDLEGGPGVVVTEPAAAVMIKPNKIVAEGKHIINNTLVNLDAIRFISDSAKIDTSGTIPYLWLKGECQMSLNPGKPLQPAMLNVALHSVSFRLDSLPLSDVDCRLRNSPARGSGISFLIRKSIVRKDGGGKDFRDTTSQSLNADGSNSILAMARLVDTHTYSPQYRHQYMVEITFHLMVEVDKDKGMGEDEFPIVGKINVPINY
ncbi:MAG: hypothetical protein U0264_15115 [Candidatus Kapaibacterium sp.]